MIRRALLYGADQDKEQNWQINEAFVGCPRAPNTQFELPKRQNDRRIQLGVRGEVVDDSMRDAM